MPRTFQGVTGNCKYRLLALLASSFIRGLTLATAFRFSVTLRYLMQAVFRAFSNFGSC
jgi:hypothetical protein